MILLGTPLSVLIIISALSFKHFLCDFIFKENEMNRLSVKNKFCLKIEHSLIHGIGTGLVTFIFTSNLYFATLFIFVDSVFHYLIDYHITKLYEQSNDAQSKSTWVMIGIDQILHIHCYLVYVLVLLFLV